MKYNIKYIVFYAMSKYLDDKSFDDFKKALARKNPKQDRAFASLVKDHFDLEKFKTDPIIWQDIWIYN